MLRAFELGLLAGVQRDAECLGQRRAQLLEVWDPVADAVDVERLARYHLGLEAVLLGFLECARELEQLAEGEVGLDGGHDFADDARQLRDDGRGRDLVHAGLHEFLLALDAADVALLIAVAHVGDGGLAVHVLHAGLEVDDEAAVVVPGVFVVHALLDVDVDAADGVDDFLEGVRVDDDVVVDVDAEEVLDGALGELLAAEDAALGAAVGVGRVDLVPAVAGDLDARVARHGEQGGLIPLRVDGGDHERVAAADVVLARVDAHDHDGRFILRREQPVLDGVARCLVEQRRGGEHGAGDGRADEAEEDEQPGPEPGFLFLPRAPRRDGGVWQDNTFFSRFGCK